MPGGTGQLCGCSLGVPPPPTGGPELWATLPAAAGAGVELADQQAPRLRPADYGVVTTWEKAIPELIEEIKKVKATR